MTKKQKPIMTSWQYMNYRLAYLSIGNTISYLRESRSSAQSLRTHFNFIEQQIEHLQEIQKGLKCLVK